MIGEWWGGEEGGSWGDEGKRERKRRGEESGHSVVREAKREERRGGYRLEDNRGSFVQNINLHQSTSRLNTELRWIEESKLSAQRDEQISSCHPSFLSVSCRHAKAKPCHTKADTSTLAHGVWVQLPQTEKPLQCSCPDVSSGTQSDAATKADKRATYRRGAFPALVEMTLSMTL